MPFRPLEIGPVIVDPPILQAPMAGFTNYACRQIIRRLGGVGLPATEMVSARGFLFAGHKAAAGGRGATPGAETGATNGRGFMGGGRDLAEPERLWGVRDEPRPLAVQIWDNDPAKLAAVGRALAEDYRVSIVDINFGCPVRDVSEKAESGSYLLRFPDRVGEIVARVAAACAPVPVTAKIRLGPSRDMINAADVVQAIEGAGGAAVTVHGRTAADFFRGSADWDQIARLKPFLRRIPLVGNGDLKTAADVLQAMSRYGVDGVMIGRAGLSHPWLFRQSAAALAGRPIPPEPTLGQQRELLLEHYRLVVEHFGAEKGTVLMRKYACCYAQGQPGARAFRGRVAQAAGPEEFAAIVEEFFPKSEAERGTN